MPEEEQEVQVFPQMSKWNYVKMCPSCKVPVLWAAELDDDVDGRPGNLKPAGDQTCHRCWRRYMKYMPIPQGCLHIWEERRV